MTKRFIITAGGSLEKWDSVRGHTNLAKGTIGRMIAEKLVEKGYEITFMHGYFTAPFIHEKVKNVMFEGVLNLEELLRYEVTNEPCDGVIMTAALSDWLVDKIYNQAGEQLEEQGKLSSNEPPMIQFKKAPKILAQIKNWKKDIVLVGFKLESNVTEEEVIKRSIVRMEQSQADYMIANFSHSLYSNTAPHFIVNRSGKVETSCVSKEETAKELAKLL